MRRQAAVHPRAQPSPPPGQTCLLGILRHLLSWATLARLKALQPVSSHGPHLSNPDLIGLR